MLVVWLYERWALIFCFDDNVADLLVVEAVEAEDVPQLHLLCAQSCLQVPYLVFEPLLFVVALDTLLVQIFLQFLKTLFCGHEGLLVVLVLCLQTLYHRLLVLVICAFLWVFATARFCVVYLLLLSPEKMVLLALRLVWLLLWCGCFAAISNEKVLFWECPIKRTKSIFL